MQSFNLNMDRPGEFVLYAKQGDSNSRFVRLALSSGGVAYVPPVGSSMTIRYGAPNMPKGWYDTIELEDGTTRPAVTQNGNVVTLELAPQLLAVPGENRVCFLFHGAEDYQLGSWNFKLLIEGDPNPDAVQSEEYINITASTLSKVAEVAAEIAATNQALATHVGDKSNPHAVTAAQVGAAPAGYGLGTISEMVDNPDNVTKTGFYQFADGTITGSLVNWYLIHQSHNETGYMHETAFHVVDGKRIERHKANGTWGEWEWDNPPMRPGVEYRTTERWNGEVKYKKLLSYSPSSFTAQAVQLPHGISNLDVGISASVTWNKDGAQWRDFPSVYYEDSAWNGDVYWSGTSNLSFELGSTLRQHMAASGKNIFVTVEYTKNE